MGNKPKEGKVMIRFAAFVFEVSIIIRTVSFVLCLVLPLGAVEAADITMPAGLRSSRRQSSKARQLSFLTTARVA